MLRHGIAWHLWAKGSGSFSDRDELQPLRAPPPPSWQWVKGDRVRGVNTRLHTAVWYGINGVNKWIMGHKTHTQHTYQGH